MSASDEFQSRGHTFGDRWQGKPDNSGFREGMAMDGASNTGTSSSQVCGMCGAEEALSDGLCSICGERFPETADDVADEPLYRSATTLAKFVAWSAGATGILSLVSAVMSWQRLSLMRILESGEQVDLATLVADQQLTYRIGIGGMAVSFAGWIAVLLWIYRANKNCHALGGNGMRYTPGWSVGWFFVPIMNWIKPCHVISEIWQASDPDVENKEMSASTPDVVGIWWCLWVVASLIEDFGLQYVAAPQNVDGWIRLSQFEMFDVLFDVPLAILTIAVVQSITARQEGRHEALSRM